MKVVLLVLQGGSEGPHTILITAAGAMYTFGTCHKVPTAITSVATSKTAVLPVPIGVAGAFVQSG